MEIDSSESIVIVFLFKSKEETSRIKEPVTQKKFPYKKLILHFIQITY